MKNDFLLSLQFKQSQADQSATLQGMKLEPWWFNPFRAKCCGKRGLSTSPNP